jgi:hypothetical protein
MEGMSGHKHDDFAPHGAFLGHAVPVRFANLRRLANMRAVVTPVMYGPIQFLCVVAGKLLHHLVQLVAVLMHAGTHPIHPGQTIPLKVRLQSALLAETK